MPIKTFDLAVKAIILDDQGRHLLLKRSMNSKHFKGQWDLPGGKVDPGENFQKALEREIEEEVGLNVQMERLAGAVQFKVNQLNIICIIMEAKAFSIEVELSHEHTDFMWLHPSEINMIDLCDSFKPFYEDYHGTKFE